MVCLRNICINTLHKEDNDDDDDDDDYNYDDNNNNTNNNNNNNNNRPDITFMNKKTKNTFLTDIAVPNTHNLAKTITDKQKKYQELANEICAMWKQNAVQVIPIVNHLRE